MRCKNSMIKMQKALGSIPKIFSISIALLFCNLAMGSEVDLDRAQATSKLNNFLLTHDAQHSLSLEEAITMALSRLETHQVEPYPAIHEPMSAIADKVKTCWQGPCEKRLSIVEKINRDINRDSGTGVVVLPSTNGISNINLFSDVIEPNCSSKASQQCAEAAKAAIDLWNIAGSFRGFANYLNQQEKSDSLATLSLLDTQWKSYKEDTIKLWPQETLLSSIVFKQNKDGFTAPPNYKLLALRPSLGLTYLSEGSPDFQPTVNMDLLGLYWWKYEQGKAQPGRGLAASLVWSGDDTAYGLTYHHNPKWAFTLAHSNQKDIVFSISFQVGYWLLKR